RPGDLLELSEDERFLLPRSYLFGDLAQPPKFAAVGFRPSIVTLPLGRMIANLFQPHQRGEDDAAPLNTIDLFELFGEIVNGLLVERSLCTAQGTEGFDLGLVGQIRN